MNPNQILSADLLDLVFSDRNKEYGAYDLRKSYDRRIKKALGITSLVLLLGVGGHLMAGSSKNNERVIIKTTPIELSEAPVDKVEPTPPPPPPPVQQPPVQTIQWTTPLLVEETDEPPPTVAETETAIIDVVTTPGVEYDGTVPEVVDAGTGVVEKQVPKEPEIFTSVQVPANYKGNWIKFLERNLNGNVPVDNNAPAGSYTVVVQFVVDLDGKVSDITALSTVGYGMEQEAIRVLKKADKWEPGIQNGHAVKSYRRQPITFRIDE